MKMKRRINLTHVLLKHLAAQEAKCRADAIADAKPAAAKAKGGAQ